MRRAIVVVATLGAQALIALMLLALSVAMLQWSADAALSLPGCDHLHDMFTKRNRVGDPLWPFWLATNWPMFMAALLCGLWLSLGLSHWRRRWARIPLWLAAQAAVLTLIWCWPAAEAGWSGVDHAPANIDLLMGSLGLALICAPIMAVWLPLERRLRKDWKTGSLIGELMRRPLRRK